MQPKTFLLDIDNDAVAWGIRNFAPMRSVNRIISNVTNCDVQPGGFVASIFSGAASRRIINLSQSNKHP